MRCVGRFAQKEIRIGGVSRLSRKASVLSSRVPSRSPSNGRDKAALSQDTTASTSPHLPRPRHDPIPSPTPLPRAHAVQGRAEHAHRHRASLRRHSRRGAWSSTGVLPSASSPFRRPSRPAAAAALARGAVHPHHAWPGRPTHPSVRPSGRQQETQRARIESGARVRRFEGGAGAGEGGEKTEGGESIPAAGKGGKATACAVAPDAPALGETDQRRREKAGARRGRRGRGKQGHVRARGPGLSGVSAAGLRCRASGGTGGGGAGRGCAMRASRRGGRRRWLSVWGFWQGLAEGDGRRSGGVWIGSEKRQGEEQVRKLLPGALVAVIPLVLRAPPPRFPPVQHPQISTCPSQTLSLPLSPHLLDPPPKTSWGRWKPRGSEEEKGTHLSLLSSQALAPIPPSAAPTIAPMLPCLAPAASCPISPPSAAPSTGAPSSRCSCSARLSPPPPPPRRLRLRLRLRELDRLPLRRCRRCFLSRRGTGAPATAAAAGTAYRAPAAPAYGCGGG